MEKKKFLVDIPVLLVFFARPDLFQKVFDKVKEARPSKLYLYQDGPRENRPNDRQKIQECREILKQIDWECEVKTMFQDENVGCDPSGFNAQSWLFQNEEYGIIIEDDSVPAVNFFSYCKEILEKYKDDERIGLVCGMNNLEKYEKCEDSYFFTQSGALCAWATWRKNYLLCDPTYSFLDDKDAMQKLKGNIGKKYFDIIFESASKHKNSGKAHFESIWGFMCMLNNKINIMSKYNQICNIGIGEEGTHTVASVKLLPKSIRQIFFMKAYELDLPLKHPKYVLEDKNFKAENDHLFGRNSYTKKTMMSLESLIYRLKYSGYKNTLKDIKKKFFK